MNYSQHNIFSAIKNSENYFIVNLLSGNADILSNSEAEELNKIIKGNEITDTVFVKELITKGYLVETEEEKKAYREKYLDFIDSREKDEIQLFFVTNYSCNFSCSYCYQDDYSNPGAILSNDIIDSFFTYIQSVFKSRKKYITVFGGEPLLDSPAQKQSIEYIVNKANEAGLDLCFVTNGYSLIKYIEIIKKGRIREIQVTLDGTADTHNKRRHLKGGGPTFDKIVAGIDACLKNNIPVNLRMVTDKDNINNLPELASFAINKGWTENRHFKTQLGRNYELHHCQSSAGKLFDRISLYENLFDLIKKYPHIIQFHKPAYSISKFLAENGAVPEPLFDSCPACKTEWAFDYTGKIYPCTATVGKEGESLGTFHPFRELNDNKAYEWEKRDVTSIPECVNCSLQLACGGGCGSVAKNKTGKICSSDCRPVKELLELGFSSYFEKK
jgi:uncharacterized protein